MAAAALVSPGTDDVRGHVGKTTLHRIRAEPQPFSPRCLHGSAGHPHVPYAGPAAEPPWASRDPTASRRPHFAPRRAAQRCGGRRAALPLATEVTRRLSERTLGGQNSLVLWTPRNRIGLILKYVLFALSVEI